MKIKLIVMLLASVLLVDVAAFADGSSRYKRRFLPAADNPVYMEECSACHFLYLPGLLPAGSWTRIIKGNEDHFGEDLALEQESSKEILDYLVANAAEKTGAKRSVKILRSLGGETPLRITDIPYWKKEHRKIKAKVFKRTSIGSASNCGACHRTAAKGNFEEDNIQIPR